HEDTGATGISGQAPWQCKKQKRSSGNQGFSRQASLVARICENVRSPQRQNPGALPTRRPQIRALPCGTSVAERQETRGRKANLCVLGYIHPSGPAIYCGLNKRVV